MTLRTSARAAVAVAFSAACASFSLAQTTRPVLLDNGLKPDDVERRPYLDYARECMDLLIERGTDRYGSVRAPILVTIIDVRTGDCPENPLPLDESVRVLRRDRRAPAGANLYMDQPVLRAMLDLAQVTGRASYADFVRKEAAYYLDNLVDEKGLLWWGWHRHYDVFKDVKSGHLGNCHEIHVQEAFWPLLWECNPAATRREIEAIWTWHVINKETGEINRHSDGQRGCDFAFTGGEIAQAFTFLYTKTGDRTWLDRAALIVEYYWKSRNTQTNLIPERPNAGSNRFDGGYSTSSIAGMHCRSLLAIHRLTGEAKYRDYALAYLKAYGRYGWDPNERWFWAALHLDGSPDTRPRSESDDYERYEPRGRVDLWQPYVAGYEFPLAAAQGYASAYAVTRDASILESAKRWADCFRREWPPRHSAEPSWYSWYSRDWAQHGTYADNYGRLISFLLQMRAATGDEAYLSFAREVAREAVGKLYYQGWLRGHPCKPYYEAVDGVGYLLRALIQLDQAMHGGNAARDPALFENW